MDVAGDRPPDHRIAAFCSCPSPHRPLRCAQQQQWWVLILVQMLIYFRRSFMVFPNNELIEFSVLPGRFTGLGVAYIPKKK